MTRADATPESPQSTASDLPDPQWQRDEIEQLRDALARAERRIEGLEAKLQAFRDSPFWSLDRLGRRLVRRLSGMRARFGRADRHVAEVAGPPFDGPGEDKPDGDKPEGDEPEKEDALARTRRQAGRDWQRRRSLSEAIAKSHFQPTISVVLMSRLDDASLPDSTRRSLQAQDYPHWELIMPVSRARHDLELIARVRTLVCPAASTPFDAVTHAIQGAEGEFVAFLAPGDRLDEDALSEMVAAIQADPQIEAIYSDQRVIGTGNSFDREWRKPAWSPVLLHGVSYIGGLLIVRRSLAWRFAAQASTSTLPRLGDATLWPYNLMLWLTEGLPKVAHLPRVLLHSVDAPDEAASDGGEAQGLAARRRALVDASMARQGFALRARPIPGLPTRCALVHSTPAPEPGTQSATLLIRADALPVGQHAGEWLNALTSKRDTGMLIVLGPGVEPTAAIDATTFDAWCADSRIGTVSGLILDDARQVIDAGLGLDRSGGLVNQWQGASMDGPDCREALACTQEIGAVTGRLAAVSIDTLRQLGGFDDTLASVEAAWVDLSLRAIGLGLRNLLATSIVCTVASRVPSPVAAPPSTAPAPGSVADARRDEAADLITRRLDGLLVAERHAELLASVSRRTGLRIVERQPEAPRAA